MRESLRAALRFVFRQPAATMAAVISLGSVFGANAALFSVADGFLLRSLPYANASQLFLLRQRDRSAGDFQTVAAAELESVALSPLIENATSFGGANRSKTIQLNGDNVSILVAEVDTAFTRTMGLHLQGDPTESISIDQLHSPAIVSSALWTRLFGSFGTGALPRSIPFADGSSVEVFGILPGDFVFPDLGGGSQPDLLMVSPRQTGMPSTRIFGIVRLRTGLGVADLQRDVDGRIHQVHERFNELGSTDVHVVGLLTGLVGSFQPMFRTMLAVSVSILLAAALSVGILLADSVVTRRREFAVRAALGASLNALSLQVVLEAALVSLFSGIVGLVGASYWLRTFLPQLPGEVYRLFAHGVDDRTLFAVLFIAPVLAMVASLAPVLDIRHEQALSISHETRSSKRHRLIVSGLLTVEAGLAVAVCLVTGRILFTLQDFETTHLGYQPANALTVDVSWPRNMSPEVRFNLFKGALVELRAIHGVSAVGASLSLPPSVNVPELRLDNAGILAGTTGWRASPEYFAASGIRVLRGREFTELDQQAGNVAVVSKQFADRAWAGQDAIGQLLELGPALAPTTVVGVVSDVRRAFGAEATPTVYLPLDEHVFRPTTIVVRTTLSLRVAEEQIRNHLATYAEPRAVTTRPLADRARRALRVQEFQLSISEVWAGLALALGLFGTSFVTARVLASRWREFGIRIALGATRTRVGRTLVLSMMPPVVIGITFGYCLYRMADSLLVHLISGLERVPRASELVVCGGFLFVAALVSAMMAGRLRYVDPIKILKADE